MVLSTMNVITSYSIHYTKLYDEIIIDGKEAYFNGGKVLIAAANPDLMENLIEKGDLVILGNRYESQLCAIEMDAACIVVCEGAAVSMTIKKIAKDHSCTIIRSPHDTYTVARLMNQSMSIRYFMSDHNLVTFHTEDSTEDIKKVMGNVITSYSIHYTKLYDTEPVPWNLRTFRCLN